MDLFETLPSETGNGYWKILLAIYPLEAEVDLGANQHLEFAVYVVTLFGKSIQNVVTLTGDNCSRKKSFPRKMGCGFVGCMRHHLDRLYLSKSMMSN